MRPGGPDPYAGFPPGFFDRADERDDGLFYAPPRLVTHIDGAAIAAVGDLYAELGIDGSAPGPRRVLDLMSSWVSHFRTPPAELVVLGMNAEELAANPEATERLVHDLNADPRVPLPDADVDAAVCCVSIDYLTRPIEVLSDVGRVLRPGGTLAVTFSNRCFPTKAVRGWLATDDDQHGRVVAELVRRTGRFDEPRVELRTPPGVGDPLYAVTATRLPDG
ncbi:class I SAM-dependent methyltransferase [Geodermatophilus sp. URMC 60]